MFLLFLDDWTQKFQGQTLKNILPETNGLHLKMDGWKMMFLLGPGLFSGAMLCSGV